MFEDLQKEIQTKPKDTMVEAHILDNPALNAGLFRQKINDMENIPEPELETMIRNTIDTIVASILSSKDSQYINVFLSPKFLSCLIRVLSKVKITYEIQVCCNKLAYDFITLKEHDPSMQPEYISYMKQLFLSLCRIVNRHVYPLLLGLALPESLALNMVIARFSIKDNDIVSTRRLNFVIANADLELMSIQNIVFIYEKLFDRMTPLVKGIMFDVFDTDEPWATDSILEIYSRIDYAMLSMLNNMTSNQIYSVLKDYSQDFAMAFNSDRTKVRFSFHCISEDFGKIVNVVEKLQSEGFYVP